MSTKTLRKRIALVAVSALGFGLVSPSSSNAAELGGAVTGITAVAATANTGTVGSAQTVFIGVTTAALAGSANAQDTLVISGKVTGFPVGGGTLITAAQAVAAASDGDANLAGTMTYSAAAGVTSQCTQTAAANGGSALAATTAATAAGTGFCKFSFTPTVAGTYTITIWGEAAAIGTINDNEAANTVTVTVGATSSVVANQFLNSASAEASTNGTLNGVRVSSVGIETVQVSGRTGIQVGFAPQYRLTRNGGASNSDAGTSNAVKFGTIAYSVTNPAGTAVTVVSAQGGTTASTSQAIAGSATPIALGADGAVAVAQDISNTTGWPQKGSQVFFSAATAGTYTITAFHDANLDTLVSVGEATTTSTVVIAADALPSITMTVFGQSTPAQAADNGVGQLVRISLKNGTAAASLGLSEVLTVSGPTGTVIDAVSQRDSNFKLAMVDNTTGNGGFTTANSTTVLLTQRAFDAAGNAYINVGNSTAGGGTYALTATISGGTGSGATGSGSFTVVDTTTLPVTQTTANTGAAITNPGNLLGVKGATLAAIADNGNNGTATWAVKRGTATTVSTSMLVGAANTTAVGKTYTATVTDTLGLITGVIGGSYKMARSLAATPATTATTAISFSVAIPALTSTQTNVATLALDVADAAGDTARTQTITITQELAAATFSYTNPALDANSYTFRAAVAASNKLTAQVVDQFGNALPNISVTAAIAGRNSTTVIPTLLTDANGQVTYTLVDASTSTTSLTDTVTFTPAAGATSTVTINYATYLPASKITMVTPDSANATATGVAGTITSDINTGKDGASATTATVSITVTDANGATLPAGVPVTFSVAGTNVAILSTKVTTVTDASGKASTNVYGWTNGNAVVTATVGTVTATGTVYFKQDDAVAGVQAEARTITATVSGNVVTAKVTDRFGNPIKGINVVASRVGTGTFNGTSSLTGVTDKAGSVDFVLTNGTADVTVAFETATFGQSAATKGFVDAGVTAIVASVAGTVSTAEKGVGASFDAAGINSVTVKAVSDTATIDQAAAATDAAAEATDAANAATDAANAAAEAADAATAAAQDAADAVAALSTQVSEMVNALKKQITALTNLVIKIQKKVRA
jgi:5-hydroxyisourate hydrolase-like protein (transthyretin family)